MRFASHIGLNGPAHLSKMPHFVNLDYSDAPSRLVYHRALGQADGDRFAHYASGASGNPITDIPGAAFSAWPTGPERKGVNGRSAAVRVTVADRQKEWGASCRCGPGWTSYWSSGMWQVRNTTGLSEARLSLRKAKASVAHARALSRCRSAP